MLSDFQAARVRRLRPAAKSRTTQDRDRKAALRFRFRPKPVLIIWNDTRGFRPN
jgi:hypothetical protein